MTDDNKSREQLIRELIELQSQKDIANKQHKNEVTILNEVLNEIKELNKCLEQQNIKLVSLNNDLSVQREWFRVTLSSIGDAVISTDLNSFVTFMNGVAEQITGYTLEESIGKHINEVFIIYNENTLEPAEIPVNRVLKEGFIIGLANHTGLISKNGERHSIADSAAPIRNNEGNIVGVVMVFRDITQAKKLEEEMARLDKLNLVGQLAAGLAHEIRNPMTTVRGFLQLMGDKKEYNKDKKYFDLMIEELERANSIIRGFLSLAKNNSVKKTKLNLNSIIEGIVPLIQADAIVYDKYVIMELGEISEEFLLNENDIRQLLLNLTRNGIEAMPSHSELIIKTHTDSRGIVLSITDQGNGIAPEIQDKINMPFFTTKETGTGLGLAICHTIAERYNATIDFQTGDTGTTFFVRFNHKEFDKQE